MVTESSLDMLPELRGGGGGEVAGRELGALLREARSREAELDLYRSGSAPPTVEGSLSAVGGMFGSVGEPKAGVEEELRSDPSYLTYYYSHGNLNPRLPPPILSKEDWRAAQRVQTGGSSAGFGGIGDRRKAAANGGSRVENGRSRAMFSLPPGFDARKEECNGEWLEMGGDGLIGLPELGLLGPKTSFGDTLQDDLGCSTLQSVLPSRPVSRNAFEDFADTTGSAEMQLAQLHQEIASTAMSQKMDGAFQGVSGSISNNFASAIGTSLSRSITPDPQLIARAPSPRLPPVGERIDKKSKNGSNSFMNSSNGMDSSDLIAALSSLSFSTNGKTDGSGHVQSKMQPDMEACHNSPFDLLGRQDHIKKPNRSARKSSSFLDNEVAASVGSNQAYTSFGLGGYSLNPASPSLAGSHLGANKLPLLYDNASNAATSLDSRLSGGLPLHPYSNVSAADIQALGRMGNHNALQVPSVDPLYFQYLGSADYAAELTPNLNGSSVDRNFMGMSYDDRIELQTAYLGALLSQQKSHYGGPLMFKSNALNGGYCGNAAMGLGMSFPGSSLGAGSPIRHNDRHLRFASGMRGFVGGAMNPWHTDMGGNLDEGFSSSLLEEFKSNKAKCFELSEIAGHVVEFSADQYGSRFIQQKLETATTEEKDMVFNEIISQALSLMTDVFGNYVVQKFFEHGSQDQRRELANQLTGHVLTLSLQMYGCRVIQKAIEVVDLDQQTKMVAELEGHIMRCVRDQNGNHVIQKCIECIPQDAIQFIVSSFYDQVVMLSTHPYGCRVIQRVLEHCDDPRTQQIMMDEILQSVCMLAQDQYGNYVVQHVLEHGKPHERSAIIEKLVGQIVQMSQQKFASNVVEKCLTFCNPEERQVLVNEMLGTTDENEPLQAMMKDQFANYVVQKVLETCEDQQRELILARIKVHLNALKKYTYGKHIVARVEKLVAAGERRTGMQTAYPLS